MRKPVPVLVALPGVSEPIRLRVRDAEAAAAITVARRDDVVVVTDPLRGLVLLLVRPSNRVHPWPAVVIGETDDEGTDGPTVLGVSTLRRLRAFLQVASLAA